MSDMQPLTDAEVFGTVDPAAEAAPAVLTDADVFAPAAPQAGGAPGAVTWFNDAGGDGLGGQFAVVELGDITASHDADLRPRDEHDAGIATQGRERADLEQRVGNIVRNFDPAQLGAAETAAEGAPVVGEDGHVEDGNARAIALQRVFLANGQKAEDYRQYLREQAPALGIDPAVIDELRKPVLVRVRTTPTDRAAVGRKLADVDLAPALQASSVELARAIDKGELDLASGDGLDEDSNTILQFLAGSAGRPEQLTDLMAATRDVISGKVSPEDASGRFATRDETARVDAAIEPAPQARDGGGDQGDPGQGGERVGLDDWQDFPAETGHLGIAREDMPQIKQGHRGALTQFLLARGIPHEQAEVAAEDLKPSQARWSPSKVAAVKRDAGDEAVLVAEDGRLLDGHHRWLSALADEAPIRVIRFAAPIERLLEEAKQFPSAEVGG